MKPDIPKPTLRRLVKLSRLLEQLEAGATPASGAAVTSGELEKITGWTRDTIRRDISQLNANCATANGYSVPLLRQAIQRRLGAGESGAKCCLVGLGRLGEALANYSGFAGTAFSIAAGFDNNVNRIETLCAPFPLYPTTRMRQIIGREQIAYAILAVPADSAQSAAEKLCECGIKGIVNFTPAVLSLPADIKIENVSVLDALQKLAAEHAVLGRSE